MPGWTCWRLARRYDWLALVSALLLNAEPYHQAASSLTTWQVILRTSTTFPHSPCSVLGRSPRCFYSPRELCHKRPCRQQRIKIQTGENRLSRKSNSRNNYSDSSDYVVDRRAENSVDASAPHRSVWCRGCFCCAIHSDRGPVG